MESLSFDPIVSLYDETRTFDDACFRQALDYVVERYPPVCFPNVFEPGIGTGRIAIPLAERGYSVTGIDVSANMLAVLRQRLARISPPLAATFEQGDATQLPFPDASFDLAVVVHLFYFIPDWKRAVDELLRVVRPDGPVIFIHTGSGMEVPWVNECYKRLSLERGFEAEHIGARSTGDVVTYAESRGCRAEHVRDRWKWATQVSLRQALSYVAARAYSFTTLVPEPVHEEIMLGVRSQAAEQFGGLDTLVEVPHQISLVVLTRA